MLPLEDTLGRIHTYLRVSVTDRCNFRCVYCMPEEGMTWLPRQDVLSYEEIARIVKVMASMGVNKVRITGGEPTLRTDITELVGSIAQIDGIDDIAMTTNGHTLERLAAPLAQAGLGRVNISLDSVDPDTFARMTRGGSLARVLAGIDAARKAGLGPIKINAVILEGENDHELEQLITHFSAHAADTHLRFIEYMPFEVRRHKTVPNHRIRSRLGERWTLTPVSRPDVSPGPARDWVIDELGLRVGFISPLSEHFCASCNRLRLMVDGHLRTCLAHEDTPTLRDLIREGCSDQGLEDAIRAMVLGKPTGHDCQLDGGQVFEGVMTGIGG